jgi:hypothetical protein
VSGSVTALVDHSDKERVIRDNERVLRWLRLVYAGDIGGTNDHARPSVAIRMLKETPILLSLTAMLHALWAMLAASRTWPKIAGLKLPMARAEAGCLRAC